MKKTLLISLSLIALAFVGCTQKTEAASTPYVTVAGGYQWSTDNAQKHQVADSGTYQKDHGLVNAAVGTKVNNVNVQVEYSQVKPKVQNADVSGKQETVALVAQVPAYTINSKVNTYGVVGIGYTDMSVGSWNTESAVGIVGAGVEWKANKTVSVLAEGRAQYVETNNLWQPQALLGVRINLNQLTSNVLGR